MKSNLVFSVPAEFYRLQCKCMCGTDAYGCTTNETERISPDKKVCGAITDSYDVLDLRVMAMHEKELTYEQMRAVEDVLGFAVTRLSRVFAEDRGNGVLDIKNLPKDTPKINQWDKKQNRALFRWVKRYTEKVRQVVTQWLTSEDGRTESFVSVKNGLLHIHIASQYPDIDLPEEGIAEIKGVLARVHKEINEIVNARLNHWREEERNGRI